MSEHTSAHEKVDIAPFDQAHPWPIATDAALSVFRHPTAHGDRVGITLRVPGATVACTVDRDLALAWANAILVAAHETSGIVLPAGVLLNGHVVAKTPLSDENGDRG